MDDKKKEIEKEIYVSKYVSKYNFADEVIKENHIGNVNICDTTLRDGEQTAGVVFSEDEKITIATMLAELGVEQIEAGIPVVSETDVRAIKKIVKANLGCSIMCWSRAVKSDIDKVLETESDAVAISIATSDIHLKYKLKKTQDEILDMMVESIEYAKAHGLYVSFNAEDGSRTDYDFLLRFTKECVNAKGDRLRLCDTVSALHPGSSKFLVRKLKKDTGVPIEFHCHNDYGLAVANALAALEAGAEYVSTTVNGIGERAGNASLEQIIVALKYLYNIDKKYKTEMLKKISKCVEDYSGIFVSQNQPIVGANAFRHESGIHTDGLIKFPYTYESFPPEDVGQKRKFVVGKMSGKHVIIEKLKEYNIEVPDDEVVDRILKEVKIFAEKRKSALSDDEFISIANTVIEGGEVFIFVEVTPKYKEKVYNEISKISDEIYTVTGEIDIIIKCKRKDSHEIMKKLEEMEGVIKTETHIVVKSA